ncbi:AraC family transcriptional regulator [Vibrio sp. T187]|uniref:AraC family transcriptional regulator n=1 Tax=Vibrio TaxID=662 RepID=UPI0010C9F66C|nr:MULTISPECIES: AraC family transcriptional regulator [Vibrio]MBW3695574.1 AraC family transcriptional regulator [Vibrio sp. T187]
MTKKSKEEAVFSFAEELGGIEVLEAKYEKQNFSRHSHEGYTIGVIEKGAQRFFRTGGNHIAPEDSIILVNADEVHNGHSASEGGWEYKAMYPLPEQFSQLTQELNGKLSGAPYFPQPVVYDPELASQLRLLFSTLATSSNRLLRETVMYAAMVKLIARHGKSRSEDVMPSSTPGLEIVREFIDDFPQADVSLEELAKLAGLSPYHMARSFQQRFGLPPHAYQVQARIRLAKQKLKLGHTISDTAQECGFHDQSHLHRHFKKALGVTPGQYLASIHQGTRSPIVGS